MTVFLASNIEIKVPEIADYTVWGRKPYKSNCLKHYYNSKDFAVSSALQSW